ncbi:hypothetical protein [Motilibacter aurantiacus]|uniref:hypothetical protein n=1 Tax=Motilibacter aurantiacus TaxID=2714955 RepID=UPI0014085CF8|nr:hypothetical protein [Motilibacter aurantiacus]NHC46912.1 hypothetical protein [Motilibacter aurantiacus]
MPATTRPARLRLLAAALGALALSACGSSGDGDVVASVRDAAAGHSGAWTDDQLRDAAGEHANVVRATPTDDGGVILVEVGRSGGTKTTKTSPSGKKTTKRTDYEVDCVEVTIDGSSVDGRQYTNESASGRPSC